MKKLIITCIMFSSCMLISCSNIIQNTMFNKTDESIFLPLLGTKTGSDIIPPEVSSVIPLPDAIDISLNSAIQVNFTEAIDQSKVNGESFFIMDGDHTISGIVSCRGNAAAFMPSAPLDPGKNYKVIITTGVADLAGNHLKNSYNWAFTAGVTTDTTPPEITYTNPVNNYADLTLNGTITVVFSKAMNNTTITPLSFIVKIKDSVTPLDGAISYTDTTAMFTPSSKLDINTIYTAAVSMDVADLSGNHLAHNYTWNFTTIPLYPHLLVPPADYNLNNGDYYFDSSLKPLTDDHGVALNPGAGVPLNNGSYNIFDASASGTFAKGTYIRIVHNGINITGPPLNLTPVAMDLSGTFVSPLGNQCYIDPALGRFILPRPVYWSKCENADNMGSGAEINTNASFSSVSDYYSYYGTLWGSEHRAHSFTSSKFGSGLYQREYIYAGDTAGNVDSSSSDNQVTICGENLDWNSGTISLWVYLLATASGGGTTGAYSEIKLMNSNSFDICMHISTDLLSGSILYVFGTSSPIGVGINNATWYHMYAIWKRDGFVDGKNVKIWLNGNLAVNETCVIPSLSNFSPQFQSLVSVLGRDSFSSFVVDAQVKVDNIKYYNHVVSEDPTWEYNGGTGRENALHYIYGPDSNQKYDYRPKLNTPGSGVGFYIMDQVY